MKYLLALSFSLFNLVLFSQETAAIEYSAIGTFNWSMFKGNINQRHLADMGKNTGAVTVSSLNYKTDIRGKVATIKISALFIPTESWTRYPKLDHPDEALNHEKRHFDICEIYARKMRQIVSKTRFDQGNLNKTMSNIFHKLAIEEKNEQNKYDRETRHSIDTKEQQKWNVKIDSQLNELSAYSNQMVKVPLH